MTQTRPSPQAAPGRDLRLYQIAILVYLLVYSVGRLHFDVSVSRIGLTLSTCLATQYLCTRLWALPRFDPRSPLISGLSLSLLLRTDLAALAVATAVVTVVSKFLLWMVPPDPQVPAVLAALLALAALRVLEVARSSQTHPQRTHPHARYPQ